MDGGLIAAFLLGAGSAFFAMACIATAFRETDDMRIDRWLEWNFKRTGRYYPEGMRGGILRGGDTIMVCGTFGDMKLGPGGWETY